MQITVPKVTVMTTDKGKVTKPDTTFTNWQVVEERETEFDIEILDAPMP
jgi:hypothetical protein